MGGRGDAVGDGGERTGQEPPPPAWAPADAPNPPRAIAETPDAEDPEKPALAEVAGANEPVAVLVTVAVARPGVEEGEATV